MKQKNSSGFTLIEMLVVLVLITLLASLVGPKLFQKVGSSRSKVAKVQIDLISSALDTYRLDVGKYPTTAQGLAVLRAKPENSKNWDGPYLSEDIPNDPWDKPYIYKRPGKVGSYALYTYGLNGEEGGEAEDQDLGKF